MKIPKAIFDPRNQSITGKHRLPLHEVGYLCDRSKAPNTNLFFWVFSITCCIDKITPFDNIWFEMFFPGNLSKSLGNWRWPDRFSRNSFKLLSHFLATQSLQCHKKISLGTILKLAGNTHRRMKAWSIVWAGPLSSNMPWIEMMNEDDPMTNLKERGLWSNHRIKGRELKLQSLPKSSFQIRFSARFPSKADRAKLIVGSDPER